MAEEKRKRGPGKVAYRNHGLSEEARKALKAHSAEWGISESVILDHLCCTHLRAVKVVPWSQARAVAAGPDDSGPAKDAGETLPIGEPVSPSAAASGPPGPGEGRGPGRGRRAAS